MLTQKTDHKDEAVSFLLTQLKQAGKLQAFLKSFVGQVQILEDEFFALLLERSIDTAIGAQLDALGTIVNVPRDGLSDDAYRLRLRVGVLANASSGTVEDILSVVTRLTDSPVRVGEMPFPDLITLVAEFQVELQEPSDVTETVLIASFVRRIRAAGVYAYVVAGNADVTPGGSEDFFSFGPNPDIAGDAFGFDNGSFVNAVGA